MPRRAVPNRFVADVGAAAPFFTDVLGFAVGMEAEGITTFVSPDQRTTQISVFTADPSGLEPAYSVEVADVDAAHARALAAGCEVVYALRDEPWGVRRFFVREPGGGIANVLQHKEQP
ncbi:MAG TPA: VOC family protein [Sphingomonas sp.]|nr:VOC family protein [Sphingomonas sp.]